MRQGFAICTHSKTEPFLWDCLSSFGRMASPDFKIYVVVTGGDNPHALKVASRSGCYVLLTNDLWEVNALKTVWQFTDLEEIFFLQDTFELLDPKGLVDLAFNTHRGKACPLNGAFQMYAGKYRRSGLDRVTWPEVRSKADAVQQEGDFTRHYLDVEPADRHVLFPNFRDSNKFVEKHGRLNMVTENAYIRKWKGTWQHNLNERLAAIAQGAV